MNGSWQAPGGGYWERDMEHASAPLTPYVATAVPGLMAGMAEGFRRYGIPLAGFDVAVVAGRLYGRVRPVGAPDPDSGRNAPSGPPPAFLMRLLFALHPELRRRARSARRAMKTHQWRAEASQWHMEMAPMLNEKNRELARVRVADLDDGALGDHIDRLFAAFVDGFRTHGSLGPTYSVPVGLWLKATVEWTGAAPDRILDLLRGSSPGSTAGVASVDKIAAAVRDVPAARAVLSNPDLAPADALAQLRQASPAVAQALDAYLDEDGYRLVTGYDVTDRTLREMPGLVVAAIAARLHALGGDPTTAREPAEQQLRDSVPAAYRTEYDTLLADARAVFGIRDEDVWLTTQWPEGMLRHGLLEAAARLQSRGAIGKVENVFDTSPEEIAPLLRGSREPTPADLNARTEERHSFAMFDPPLSFGKPSAPPPADLLPGAIGLITGAVLYLREIDAHRSDPVAGLQGLQSGGLETILDARVSHPVSVNSAVALPVVTGAGVSSGQYLGRARVVLSPADFGRIVAGDVLVAKTTSPSYNVLLPLLGAIVTDRGGLLSHAALVAREFGIPAVVGATNATSTIPDGALVRVDSGSGRVTILSHATTDEPTPLVAGVG